MRIDFANIWTKPFFKTILFYLIAALTIYIFEKIAPSGPCTPGFGILTLLLLPFVSGVLLIINLIKLYKGQKEFGYSALIHFVFIIGLVIYLKTI